MTEPISITVFLAMCQAIQAAKPKYGKGHDGDDGLCDCIGLIIGAIRRAGGEWKGTHGSNYAARNEMRELVAINNVSQLQPGWAVYKRWKPGDAKYALPASYKSNADQGDYYHVGVVISVTPLQIMHCTSWTSGGVKYSGIKIDTALGSWKWGGRLKKVAYDDSQEGGEKVMETLWVGRVTGGRLRMREAANDDAELMLWIPDGAEVKVLDKAAPEGWAYVEYAGKQGYCMVQYLRNVESIPDGSVRSIPVTVAVDQAKLDKLQQTIATAQTALTAVKDAVADFVTSGISVG